jgi:hypothetical protein
MCVRVKAATWINPILIEMVLMKTGMGMKVVGMAMRIGAKNENRDGNKDDEGEVGCNNY